MHRNRKLRITNYELGEIKAQIGSIVLRHLSLLKHKVFLLLIILFGAGISSVYAGSVFLSKSVNLSVQNVTLEQALHQIEERTGVQFMYNPRMLKSNRKVSIQKQASVQELLQQLINNNELVFYELNNVVVITSRREAPKQVQVVSAAPAAPTPTTVVVHKTVYDTVTISRTVTVYDTSRLIVTDTVRVYDTVKPTIKPLAESKENKSEATASSADVISSVGIKNLFITLEGGPQYSDLMPNYTWLSDLSLSGRAMIGCKWDNLFVSMGVGVLWQRGGSIGSKLTIYTDSTLMRDTIKVMQKYKVGEYWGFNDKGIYEHKEIFDSVLVDVPRQWFNVRRREVKTDSTIGHRVTWVTLPCRIGGEWTFSRKTMMGISLCVSPAFSVLNEGYVFDDKTNRYRTVKDFGLKSFALFLSFEPSISYTLSKTLSLQIVPIVQLSAGSIFTKEAYYLSAGTFVGLRKLF